MLYHPPSMHDARGAHFVTLKGAVPSRLRENWTSGIALPRDDRLIGRTYSHQAIHNHVIVFVEVIDGRFGDQAARNVRPSARTAFRSDPGP